MGAMRALASLCICPCLLEPLLLKNMDLDLRKLSSGLLQVNTGEISIFLLVSVAEEIDLSLTLSEMPKTGFITSRPI